MTTPPAGAIVVGIDGSADSDRAVAWALALAARTGRPVHFVHSSSAPPAAGGGQHPGGGADAIVAAAMERARGYPGVAASAAVIEGPSRPAAQGLIEASADAALLVVGARGHGGFGGLLVGSVSQHLARHATCPVVTVREQSDPREDRIVVGVDGSEGAQQALGFAFDLAAELAVGVTAIHVWHEVTLYGPGVALPMPPDVVSRERAALGELNEALSVWRQKYPQVRITSEAIPGHPGRVLTDASEHAALVVTGSRGRGAFAGLLLGSVGQHVLHHAKCPVAVVH